MVEFKFGWVTFATVNTAATVSNGDDDFDPLWDVTIVTHSDSD